MYKLSLIVVVVMSSTLLLASGTSKPNICPFASTDNEELQVRQLLADAGAKNGVTFTIEEGLLKGGASDRIRSFRHHTLPEGTSLKAVLDDLSQSVPNFTWYTDPNNPKIIHIVDDHLLRRPGYALDRVINDIDLSGTVVELVDAIAAKGVPISAVGPMGSQDVMFTDFSTRVQVKGKGLKVRDALTDFVTLEGRGPILWFSETHLDGPDQTTYVRFQGAPLGKPTLK